MNSYASGDGTSRFNELRAEFEAERETRELDNREIGDHSVRVTALAGGHRRYSCRRCGMVRTAAIHDFRTAPCEPPAEDKGERVEQ